MAPSRMPMRFVIFLSTPSARRATIKAFSKILYSLFLSTPSARRATRRDPSAFELPCQISIHALREEGDRIRRWDSIRKTEFLSTPSARRATPRSWTSHPRRRISIHALREEGDRGPVRVGDLSDIISIHALREEGDICCLDSKDQVHDISIHALREEGDAVACAVSFRQVHFYPRPPRGGRHVPAVS